MKKLISLLFVSFLLVSVQSKASLIELTFESYIPNTLNPSGVTYGSFVFDNNNLQYDYPASYPNNSYVLGVNLIDFNFSYDDSSNGNGIIAFDINDINPNAAIALFTPPSIADYDLRFSLSNNSSILTDYVDSQTPYFSVRSNSLISFGGLSAVNFSTARTVIGFWRVSEYNSNQQNTTILVPEPTSLVILASSIFAFGCFRRRKLV